MAVYTQPVQALIDELGRLPGIGPKSAQRIAFHLLKGSADDANRLAHAIREAKEKVRFCERCFNFADAALCPICADDRRDSTIVCVVEESRDIVAIERTGEFRGRYHVLLGALAPLDGIGPDELKIQPLLVRLRNSGLREVILATNPTAEGEATALYIARLLKPHGVRVTRIARGLPMGGDVEYTDAITLSKSLEGRREM
jgi:recombination protein RecR